MHDSRETFLTGAFVAGYPIKHSRSPIIHSYWLQQHGLIGGYDKLEIDPADIADFFAGMKSGKTRYRGGNITIPHKEAAFQIADVPDMVARQLGAANTLWLENGLIHATNTDVYGFLANLDQGHAGWDKARKAVVLGAGGASRAIIQGLLDRGLQHVHVVNRTLARAQDLADHFGAAVHAHGREQLQEVLQGADLLVNTTSLGMNGEDVPQIDWERLSPGALVTDIVYTPLETGLLRQARAAGFATVDGLGMLLHQAVPGFEKWFGVRPEVTDDLRQLLIADLEKQR
ncbi:shikimate dehydrogenase [Agrobacterium vitis]|uniref:shikimate dehydrogenase n=1 Tax=Allorhizobium ampelinum TaxID=3025782 RepID=UPI001F3F9250|nr:shikimate dehydrogenase [Allorhizobium ampelinum]MCF1461683.1 shikimate dehydrogenase [Allorhizobium ampelinum]